MKSNLNQIKNIIFDLGGVILKIDYQKTVDAFIKLGISNFDEVFSKIKQNNITDDFEEGKITQKQFFDYLNSITEINLSDEDILDAWNCMILEFPKENFDILKQLGNDYRIFLLSNTNQTHLNYFSRLIDSVGSFKDFESNFEKLYYSHDLGYRKPKPEAFQYILDENGLIPEETIFVDDLEKNLEPAKKLKINTFHHDGNAELKEFLLHLKS